MDKRLIEQLREPLNKCAGGYEKYRTKQPLYTKDQVFMAVEWLLFELDDRRLWEYCPISKEEKLKIKAVKLKIKDAFEDVYRKK